jgi:hypothetical protein
LARHESLNLQSIFELIDIQNHSSTINAKNKIGCEFYDKVNIDKALFSSHPFRRLLGSAESEG